MSRILPAFVVAPLVMAFILPVFGRKGKAAAMLSGVLIKALGVYALSRLIFNVFGVSIPVSWVLIALGVLSMIVGVFLAVGQWDFKRLLSTSEALSKERLCVASPPTAGVRTSDFMRMLCPKCKYELNVRL